jgi:hypothetical protein
MRDFFCFLFLAMLENQTSSQGVVHARQAVYCAEHPALEILNIYFFWKILC